MENNGTPLSCFSSGSDVDGRFVDDMKETRPVSQSDNLHESNHNQCNEVGVCWLSASPGTDRQGKGMTESTGWQICSAG